MARKIIAYTLTAAAGSSGYEDIYTVPDGREYRLQRIIIAFPAGTEGKLGLVVMHGIDKVVPDVGEIRGDNTTYDIDVDEVYSAGSSITVSYTNYDSAYEKTAFIIVVGDET